MGGATRQLGNTMRKLRNCIYLQILRTLAVPSGLPLAPIQPAPLTQWWFWEDHRAPCGPAGRPRAW